MKGGACLECVGVWGVVFGVPCQDGKGSSEGFPGCPISGGQLGAPRSLVHQSPSSFISKMGRMRFVSACC